MTCIISDGNQAMTLLQTICSAHWAKRLMWLSLLCALNIILIAGPIGILHEKMYRYGFKPLYGPCFVGPAWAEYFIKALDWSVAPILFATEHIACLNHPPVVSMIALLILNAFVWSLAVYGVLLFIQRRLTRPKKTYNLS